uniref:Uncharacterized protein n=1 Tax=Arundo donax TaxID=35708 RepID=A0A0A9HUD4_ARUDO
MPKGLKLSNLWHQPLQKF